MTKHRPTTAEIDAQRPRWRRTGRPADLFEVTIALYGWVFAGMLLFGAGKSPWRENVRTASIGALYIVGVRVLFFAIGFVLLRFQKAK